MDSVNVVVPLGGNPGPLFGLLWALGGEGRAVGTVRVVVEARGRGHLRQALEAAWDELRAARPGGVPERGAIGVIEVEAGAAALGEGLWQAVSEATREEAPMVLALGGGRHRTAAVLAATCFSFRGRQRDRLVDLRYGSKEAEQHTGFLFPAQREQVLRARDGSVFRASEVTISIEDVPMPRLRRVLGELERPHSFSAAVTLGQRALDALAKPELVIDLAGPEVRLDGAAVPLSPLEVLWLGAVAHARLQGEDEGWVRLDDDSGVLARFIGRVRHHAWVSLVPAQAVRFALGESAEAPTAEAMRKLRSRTTRSLARFVAREAPSHRALLRLRNRQAKKEHFQRLELPAAYVRLAGLR